ncbi:MAG: hypothetical protein NZ957_05600 [Thaumarchaeota archaeon]|nr:hypothetical protein [Candidatus Calditenuaceae archaeon]MDW8041487.1 hypothetical protein [Nitrososphaerota archaeon]
MDEKLERAVLKFVQTLFSGRYSDAERIAENLEKRAKSDDELKVARALRGLYLSYTTDDAASIVHKTYSSGDPKSELAEYVRSMREANGGLGGASTIIEVWEVLLKNFERLPKPDRYGRKAEGSD